jgi:hypothetical protein
MTTITVPVPPKPKEPYYEFDVVAALRRDAAPEARALALLVVARQLLIFAQELEFQPASSAVSAQLRKQADSHRDTALQLMQG